MFSVTITNLLDLFLIYLTYQIHIKDNNTCKQKCYTWTSYFTTINSQLVRMATPTPTTIKEPDEDNKKGLLLTTPCTYTPQLGGSPREEKEEEDEDEAGLAWKGIESGGKDKLHQPVAD